MPKPSTWTPEWFLAWLMANPDAPLQETYKKWAQEWGIRQDYILQDIKTWRRTVPGFKDAMQTVKPVSRCGGLSMDDTDPLWRERFCEIYRVNHNRRKTCEEMGLNFATLRTRISPSHARYDVEFHRMLQDVEAETVEAAREGVKTGLEVLLEAAAAGDIRAADSVVKQGVNVLERREPQDWSRHQVNHVQGTILHASVDARRVALAGALTVSRQIVEASQPALPPAPLVVDVVEGELVKEERP